MREDAVIILGIGPGSSKTVLSVGLLRALSSASVKAAPFKCMSVVDLRDTQLGNEVLQAADMGIVHQVRASTQTFDRRMNIATVVSRESAKGTLFLDEDLVCDVNLLAPDSVDICSLPTSTRLMLEKKFADALEYCSKTYEFLVIEGSGCAVEIPAEFDLANIWIARHCMAPIVLVGRLSRGGCAAGILGTFWALPEDLRSRVSGFVLSDPRDDNHLRYSASMIEQNAPIRFLGILPQHPLWTKFPQNSQEFELAYNTWAELAANNLKLEAFGLHIPFKGAYVNENAH